MNSAVVIFACLFAAVSAQCPDNNCPPPTFPDVDCGVPDCSLLNNRYRDDALFPHPDPNFYWQCAPLNTTHWAAKARPCACETVFNPNLSPPRCSFWFEEGWQPICSWTSPPVVTACTPWCPDCNGDKAPGPDPITTTSTTRIPDDDNNNNCPCPCAPCIWWPCVPCPQINTCSCNSNRLG